MFLRHKSMNYNDRLGVFCKAGRHNAGEAFEIKNTAECQRLLAMGFEEVHVDQAETEPDTDEEAPEPQGRLDTLEMGMKAKPKAKAPRRRAK